MSKAKRTNHESQPIIATRAGRRVLHAAGAVGLTATLAGTAVVANWASNEADGTRSYEQDSAIAVRGVDQVLGNVIILKSGAHYRVSPNDSTEANNVVTKVPKGKELLIDTPYISPEPYLSSNQAGWIGFTRPGAKTSTIKSPEDRAQVTVWANLPKLEQEGYALVYPDHAEPGVTQDAHVAANGAVVIDGKVDPNAGTAISEAAGSFESITANPDSY